MIKSVSLIIPFKSDKSEKEKLFTLLRGISNWKAVPNEIIIIKKSKPKNIEKSILFFRILFNQL